MSYSRHRGISKPLPGCFVDWTHPLSRGLIGCWMFNERAGSTVVDMSGNRITGSVIGMVAATGWVGSPRGGCLTLNGSSNYIDLGLAPCLNTTVGLTVFARVMPTAAMATFSGIIQSAKDSSSESGFILLGVTAGGPGDAGFIRFYGSKPSHAWAYAQSDVVLRTLQWYNLAGVWNGANISLYVDGVAQSTVGSLTSIFYGTLITSAMIGRYSGASAEVYYNGCISDIRIFNRPLSTSEIVDLNNPAGLYSNILSPSYRRYFIPAAGGLSIPVAMHYRRMMGRN